MDNVLRVLIVAVVTFLAVPWVIGRLSRASQAAYKDKDCKILRYSTGMTMLTWFCSVFFLTLAYLGYRFPGGTDPSTLPFAILIFLAFALMSFVSACNMPRAFVVWSEHFISGLDWLGRRRTINWTELDSVEYVDWAQSIKITAKKGNSILVSPAMQGYVELEMELEKQAEMIAR